VSTQQRASNGTIQVLRGATYFVALLFALTGTLLAFVASVPAYVGFGLLIAAVLILLAHQRLGRMTLLTAILLILSFTVPAIFVHETPDTTGCAQALTPCDPAMNSHLGLRLGLAAALLFAALVTAGIGLVRSSRPTDASDTRHP
jgi:hypothetical protein